MIQDNGVITCVFLGEQLVGKTSLIMKYFRGKHTIDQIPTIAVSTLFSTYRSSDGTEVKIHCWDTAGNPKYKHQVYFHLKAVDIVVLMYDITNLTSFRKIRQWNHRLKQHNIIPSLIILLGNKKDLLEIDESLRKVTKSDAIKCAKQLKAQLHEISVSQNVEFSFIDDAFDYILSMRTNKLKSTQNDQINKSNSAKKDLMNFSPLNSQQDVRCKCPLF